MQYRMPTYRRGEKVLAYAVQKNYLSIYINDEAMIREHAAGLGKHRLGKKCIRYAAPENINMHGLGELIRDCY